MMCQNISLRLCSEELDNLAGDRFTEFQPKEPCLTPTLMDEGQARNPNTTYIGYKIEFWNFA